MVPFRRAVARVGLASALLALAACERESPAEPPVVEATPSPAPAPVRSVIARPAPIERLETGSYAVLSLQIGQGGTLDVTVDWTFADSWIYVYLGHTPCNYAQLARGECPFLISSETQFPKPRVLRSEPVGPGTYYVVLHNVPRDPRSGRGSDNVESLSIEIGLTTSSSAGATGTGGFFGPAGQNAGPSE